MGLLGNLRRGLVDAARTRLQAALAANTAHGVTASEILLSIDRADGAYMIKAKYVLSAKDPTDRRPLTLNLVHRLTLLDLSSSVARIPDGKQSWIGRPFVALELEAGASWHGSEIEAVLQWTPNQSTSHGPLRYIPLPAGLPELPLLPRTPSHIDMVARPRLKLMHDLPRGLSCGFIATNREAAAADGYLQLLLFEGVNDAGDGNESVLVAGGRARTLSGRAKGNVVEILSEIRAFLGKEFQLVPRTRIVAAMDDPEVVSVGLGCCVVAPPEWYGIGRDSSGPYRAPLARTVAGVWWGGGCVIVGDNAGSLATGLGAAFGLRWAASTHHTKHVNEMIELYRRAAMTTREKGGQDAPLHYSEIALVLYERLRNDAHALAALREVVNDHWGKLIAETTLVDALARAGLTLR